MSSIQQKTLEGLEYSIQRETKKRMRSSGGVIKSGEYEIKLSDLASGLQPDEAAQLNEWVGSKSTWRKVKFVLSIDDVGHKRGVDRKVQIHVGDVDHADLVSRAKREFLDAQNLGINDDATDALEATGNLVALSRREDLMEVHELTGDLHQDLQSMKSIAAVKRAQRYYNEMCDARIVELKSKKRSRQSGEEEEDDAEELEGRSAYEDAALKGIACYIVIIIDNSIIIYSFMLFYSMRVARLRIPPIYVYAIL